jgi:hypothetical protein
MMDKYSKKQVVDMLLVANETLELYSSQNVLLSAVNARLEKRNETLKRELQAQKSGKV